MPKVLVSAANGRTGRAIVGALLARGAQVRGLVRKPEHIDKLKAMGAEGVVGDLEDAASLVAAAQGCDVLVHVGPPMYPREVETTQNMLDAAAAVGAKQFVYYSVMHPLRQDVEHHKLKLITEEHVVESPTPYTIVQPIRYMQHLDPIWGQVKDKGEHAMPFNTHLKFNVVDLADLAEATAITVTEPGHLYATYELAGPEGLSQDDMAAILSEELGRPVKARHISLDELRESSRAKGIAEDRIGRMAKMNAHYDAHGFRGNPNVLSWLLGRKPATYRDYVKRLVAAG
jgi:uncharacterized protein YbjT (DUF2867 family)